MYTNKVLLIEISETTLYRHRDGVRDPVRIFQADVIDDVDALNATKPELEMFIEASVERVRSMESDGPKQERHAAITCCRMNTLKVEYLMINYLDNNSSHRSIFDPVIRRISLAATLR
jgi:hypothetical protein